MGMPTAAMAPLLDTSLQTTSAITVKIIKPSSSFGDTLDSAKTKQQQVCNKIREFPRDQQLILTPLNWKCYLFLGLKSKHRSYKPFFTQSCSNEDPGPSPNPEPTLSKIRHIRRNYCC